MSGPAGYRRNPPLLVIGNPPEAENPPGVGFSLTGPTLTLMPFNPGQKVFLDLFGIGLRTNGKKKNPQDRWGAWADETKEVLRRCCRAETPLGTVAWVHQSQWVGPQEKEEWERGAAAWGLEAVEEYSSDACPPEFFCLAVPEAELVAWGISGQKRNPGGFRARCGVCFGRGYLGGGSLPTCHVCRGRGSLVFETEEAARKHEERWDKKWRDRAKKKKNPREGFRRPPRKKNPDSKWKEPPPEYEVQLEEVLDDPYYDKASRLYERFHGREPTKAKVVQIDDGEDEVTRSNVMVLLHKTEEVPYYVDWDSDKRGDDPENPIRWYHPHPEGSEPYKVWDPRTELTMDVGGTALLDDYWYS